MPLVPALQKLRGLIYYHAAVDETAGVHFDPIANYEPLWKIEGSLSAAAAISE